MKYRKSTYFAAFFGILGVFGQAQAEPIIEVRNVIDALTTTQTLSQATAAVYGSARDLVFGSNQSGRDVDDIARVNGLVLFGDEARVKALGKVDEIGRTAAPQTTVESFDDALTFNEGALTVTCTDAARKCGTFDWSFDQSLVEGLEGAWDIVKIGVKYGGGRKNKSGTAYFLIDPEGNGADAGSFDIFAYVEPSDNGPLDGIFNHKGKLRGLSHVDFFGSQDVATNTVPEPAAFGLFGIGLIGLGLLARHRRRQDLAAHHPLTRSV